MKWSGISVHHIIVKLRKCTINWSTVMKVMIFCLETHFHPFQFPTRKPSTKTCCYRPICLKQQVGFGWLFRANLRRPNIVGQHCPRQKFIVGHLISKSAPSGFHESPISDRYLLCCVLFTKMSYMNSSPCNLGTRVSMSKLMVG